MAKAASPIRIQDDLMQQATLTGKRYHRSAAQQIEYWADIGRQVSSQIDPDTLITLSMGLAELDIKPVTAKTVNPDKIFQQLEESRKTGQLANEVSDSKVRYQASEKYPGYLEQIDDKGNILVGQFNDGKFVTLKG